MSEEQASSASIGSSSAEVRGVEGRVAEMKVRFSNGAKASNPVEYENIRKEAQRAKAIAARYNMILRGQQMLAKRKMEGKHVSFEPHEFSQEWEEYPWHLAAAFTDEDDAFWMPELAMALENEDDQEINRAVLRFFLEENDPERLGDIERLLQEFAGNEELLFVSLQQEYSPTVQERKGEVGISKPPPSISNNSEEEEKSTDTPLQEVNRRRPSFVVSGMKKDNGWELNATDDGLKEKMASSGEAPEIVRAVVNVATESPTPYAPGGTSTE